MIGLSISVFGRYSPLTELIKFHDFVSARSFLEASRDAVFVISDEKIEYVNETAAKLLGFERNDDIIGRWSCEFISPEDRRAQYKPAGKTTPFRYELKFRRKDGTDVDVENQISIIEYDGRPASLVFSRDISERKFFEAKLDAVHKHAIELRNVETLEEVAKSTVNTLKESLGFENVGFGVVEKNLLSFKEFSVKSTVRELPVDGSGITVRAVNTGETQLVADVRRDEAFVPSNDLDRPETLSEIAVPIKIGCEVFGVINVESSDVNAFDENDRKLLETLAQHVASKIATIIEKQKLQKSLKELESKNHELDEYTYAVSHDLKAPLRSIQAFCNLLLDASDKLDEAEVDYLNRISNASARMKQLIEDLLVLSRVNRKYLDIESVDLNRLVEHIKMDLEALIKEKKAEIIFSELPTISCHNIWIQQLFSNLISNGIKFNRSVSPKIWIGFEEHYDYYQFSIKDNGIGIEERDFPRIFKLFQRLHSEDEYPGTGAGLTICKKIVESYGGEIWLESKPGLGSMFYFTLLRAALNREAEIP
jgi:PAS domain S-box-containing protein